jgi:hypothetical protein
MTYETSPPPCSVPQRSRLFRAYAAFKEAFEGPVGLKEAVLAFITWRLPLILLLTFTRDNLPPGPGATGMPALPNSALAAWHRWDSGWYVRIVRDGYAFISPETNPCQSSIAFFPLFPMLTRGLMKLGVPMMVGNVMIANVSTLIGLWGLGTLARRFVGIDGGRRAMVALLVFPTTIFLSAAYTEPLFIALAVWGLEFFERRRPLPTALCTAAAALTRANGAVLAASICVAALAKRQWSMLAFTVAFTAATLGSFCYYQHVTFGDALAFIHARKCWGVVGQHPIDLLEAYISATRSGHQLEPWLDCLSALWLAVICLPAFRRLGVVYGCVVLGTLLAVVQSGQLWGMSRIATCALPGYILLARWTAGSRRVRVALAAIGMSILAIEGYRFVNGYWVSEYRGRPAIQASMTA